MKVLFYLSVGLIAFTYNAVAESAKIFSPEQIKAVQQIVAQHIKDNPQAIAESLKVAMEQQQLAQQEGMRREIANNKRSLFNNPQSPVTGNSKGDETIVVFVDPRCGHCQSFQVVLNQVQKQRKTLRVVYKLIPILGDESVVAAREEIAANMQGKFEEFRQAVYESNADTREERMKIAKEVGIEMTKFAQHIKSAQVTSELKNNQLLASKLEIDGTPTCIVGNTLVPGGVPSEELIKLLDKAKKRTLKT